jgi:hypothetical protein
MTKEEAILCIKGIKNLGHDMFTEQKDFQECLDMAIKALEQEPKTGHWIATGAYFTGAYSSIDYVKCSCCGYESLEEGHFCPFCGARMEN